MNLYFESVSWVPKFSAGLSIASGLGARPVICDGCLGIDCFYA